MLDTHKVSDRNAPYLLMVCIEVLGYEDNELIINRSLFNRIPEKIHKDRSIPLGKAFKINFVKKQLYLRMEKSFFNRLKLVERLPVIINFGGPLSSRELAWRRRGGYRGLAEGAPEGRGDVGVPCGKKISPFGDKEQPGEGLEETL